MKVQYFPDTDTLYLTLQNKPSVESEEVSPEIILDLVVLNSSMNWNEVSIHTTPNSYLESATPPGF